jgi:hypothetical protein
MLAPLLCFLLLGYGCLITSRAWGVGNFLCILLHKAPCDLVMSYVDGLVVHHPIINMEDCPLLAVQGPLLPIPDKSSHTYLLTHVPNLVSVVGIAMGYGLDGPGSIPGSVQTDSGAHLASCPMGTGGYFPGGKAAGSCSRPLTSI